MSLVAMSGLSSCTCVTRRKLQTPGTAEEHKGQETPTINPNDRQPTQLTDQAPGNIQRAARESRHTTPISTATTRHQYPHATGSSPDPLSQRSLCFAACASQWAEPHYNTDITRLSGDTYRSPGAPPVGPSSGVADGQPRAHGLLLRRGRGEGWGGGG